MSTATPFLGDPTTAKPDGYPFHIGTRYLQGVDEDGKRTVTPVPLSEEDFLHPQEEDRFMLTDAHTQAVFYIVSAIQMVTRNRPGIRVLSDHRVDWQYEDIPAHGPDIVAFDNFPSDWDPYLGTFPVVDFDVETLVVFEVTSESTRHIDLGKKFDEFTLVGIPYYLIVDVAEPTGARGIRGYHLNGSHRYQEMRRDATLGFMVPGLRMYFRWDAEADRVVAADEDGRDIPYAPELADQLDGERQRADDAEIRSDRMELRAESAEQQAQAEKKRADQLAQELSELRAKLSQSS